MKEPVHIPKESPRKRGPKAALDMTEVENILRRTKLSIQKTYEKYGDQSELYLDSIRKEMAVDSLDIAREVLNHLKTKKQQMTPTELTRAFATLVSNAKLLAVNFQDTTAQKTKAMTDEELESLAGGEKTTEVN